MSKKEGTKLCKHCKTEIPAGAKVCPNCRKKQGGIVKWIVIGVIVLAVIGSVAGGGEADGDVKEATNPVASDSKKSDDKKEEKQEEKTEFALGETAEQKNVQVTLLNVTESTGSEYITPDEGNLFLICEFEIVNNSDKDITVSSISNFEAYCDDYSLNQDIIGLQVPEAEGKSQLDGNVAAGKKMNGIIAFQIPSDYKKFEISVAPDFWATRDIKFVINK